MGLLQHIAKKILNTPEGQGAIPDKYPYIGTKEKFGAQPGDEEFWGRGLEEKFRQFEENNPGLIGFLAQHGADLSGVSYDKFPEEYATRDMTEEQKKAYNIGRMTGATADAAGNIMLAAGLGEARVGAQRTAMQNEMNLSLAESMEGRNVVLKGTGGRRLYPTDPELTKNTLKDANLAAERYRKSPIFDGNKFSDNPNMILENKGLLGRLPQGGTQNGIDKTITPLIEDKKSKALVPHKSLVPASVPPKLSYHPKLDFMEQMKKVKQESKDVYSVTPHPFEELVETKLLVNEDGKEIPAGVVEGKVVINDAMLRRFSEKEVLKSLQPSVLQNLIYSGYYQALINTGTSNWFMGEDHALTNPKNIIRQFIVEHEKAHINGIDGESEANKYAEDKIQAEMRLDDDFKQWNNDKNIIQKMARVEMAKILEEYAKSGKKIEFTRNPDHNTLYQRLFDRGFTKQDIKNGSTLYHAAFVGFLEDYNFGKYLNVEGSSGVETYSVAPEFKNLTAEQFFNGTRVYLKRTESD